MKTKKIMVFLIMAMLAAPAFALAGGIPDTGQTTSYDNEVALKALPTTCGESGCARSFVIGEPVNKTLSKIYDSSGNEFTYYGFRRCYSPEGLLISCTPTCKNKTNEVVPCPTGTCYDSAAEATRKQFPCPTDSGTGTNDFYGQDANYSVNSRSYTKLGYGGTEVTENWKMVKDNRSALVWEVKGAGTAPDLSAPNNSANTYTWADAQSDFITKLNFTEYGGYKDWRLPTAKELATIISCGKSNPAIDIDPKTGYFLNMKALHYWTSTTKGSQTDAYYVDFQTGSVGSEVQTTKNYAIAVRGTVASEAGRFIDNSEDVTVTDKLSGLMWKKNTVQVTGNYNTDWEGAVASCQAVVSPTDGYSDWRLPSRTELISLIDYSKTSGLVIDTALFPDVSASASVFWTSSTYAGAKVTPDDGKRTQAWCVNFADGTVIPKEKAETYYVLAVRGGQNEQPTTNLVLSEPKQTSAWELGRVMPIIWTTPAAIKTNVKISVSSDGGKSYDTIVESTPNDGSYIWWNIGQTDAGASMALPASDTYTVKIEPADGSAGQTVQGVFSVTEDLGAGAKVELSDVIKWLQVLVGN